MKTNDRRRQFVSAVSSAIHARKMARVLASEQELCTQEEIITRKQHDLNKKAKALIDLEEDCFIQELRLIFDQLSHLDRRLKQLRIARKLGAAKSSTENSFFLRAMREGNVRELRFAQKLMAASGCSERQLEKCEAKLHLLEENEEEQDDQDEEDGVERRIGSLQRPKQAPAPTGEIDHRRTHREARDQR